VINQIVQLTKCISTVRVEAEYTAIEVKGDNLDIWKAEYIPVGTNDLTPLVSIQFDLITD
jgi:hypothetical protein